MRERERERERERKREREREREREKERERERERERGYGKYNILLKTSSVYVICNKLKNALKSLKKKKCYNLSGATRYD